MKNINNEITLVFAGGVFIDAVSGNILGNKNDVIKTVNNQRLTVKNQDVVTFADKFWFNK